MNYGNVQLTAGKHTITQCDKRAVCCKEKYDLKHELLTYAADDEVLCRVHTCHTMAPLNGTILWRHKIAQFLEAINLLLQNLWRHKLPLSCVKFHRY